MIRNNYFSYDEAKSIGDDFGIRWRTFHAEQFQLGMNMELEHGKANPSTNVTNDDPMVIARLVWAHLRVIPDYYDRLKEMEKQARFFWRKQFKRIRLDIEKVSEDLAGYSSIKIAS
jgi:hypothetical protein